MKKVVLTSWACLALLNVAIGCSLRMLVPHMLNEFSLLHGVDAALPCITQCALAFWWWPFIMSAIACFGLLGTVRPSLSEKHAVTALIAILFLDICLLFANLFAYTCVFITGCSSMMAN